MTVRPARGSVRRGSCPSIAPPDHPSLRTTVRRARERKADEGFPRSAECEARNGRVLPAATDASTATLAAELRDARGRTWHALLAAAALSATERDVLVRVVRSGPR